jgi:hypothetical protein
VAAAVGVSVGVLVGRLAFGMSGSELVPVSVSATAVAMTVLWRTTTPQKR